jgi:excisionase family DNA binding protein
MNEWTEVAAYRFIEQAMQVFPGSREEGTLSEGEVPGYLARNGYPALEAWPLCHGSKTRRLQMHEQAPGRFVVLWRSRGEPMSGQLLTAREVADELGVSTETVLRWVRRGELPAFRLGRAVRFREHEIQAWLEDRATCPNPGNVLIHP